VKLATLSPKTVTNHLIFLYGLFAFAVRGRWARTNPVALVDRPPAVPRHGRRIRCRAVEVEALLRAVLDDSLGRTDAALYLCAVTTGLRQGELLALTWLDVDWLARRIRVADNFPRGHTDEADTPKSRHLRSVPMADRLAPPSSSGTSSGRPFAPTTTSSSATPPRARPTTPRNCASASTRRLDAPAFVRITFLELRRTFGTKMAASGAPLRALREWMGHSDAKSTEIYSHYAPDATNAATFVERAFGGDADSTPRCRAAGRPARA
jgi:integrase